MIAGKVIAPFRGRIVECLLGLDGRWSAPEDLRVFLDRACPGGRERPSDGPTGRATLDRAAWLLSGTAVYRGGGKADPNECDGQADCDTVGFSNSEDAGVLPIPPGAIKVFLPNLRQARGWNCGPAILEAVAIRFGVNAGGDRDENWFSKRLGTSQRDGTPPPRLAAMADVLGLNPDVRHPMSDADLRSLLDAGKPVVCCVQAWGTPRQYADLDSGHYVAAIGYDDDHVYLEDPVLRKTRGFMTWRQFGERWHDRDGNGNQYVRWGCALFRPEPKATHVKSEI